MTGQLGSICTMLKSAENTHNFTSATTKKQFGPTWDKVFISFRDPPPNKFTLPEDLTTPLLLIAAGSGIGQG